MMVLQLYFWSNTYFSPISTNLLFGYALKCCSNAWCLTCPAFSAMCINFSTAVSLKPLLEPVGFKYFEFHMRDYVKT